MCLTNSLKQWSTACTLIASHSPCSYSKLKRTTCSFTLSLTVLASSCKRNYGLYCKLGSPCTLSQSKHAKEDHRLGLINVSFKKKRRHPRQQKLSPKLLWRCDTVAEQRAIVKRQLSKYYYIEFIYFMTVMCLYFNSQGAWIKGLTQLTENIAPGCTHAAVSRWKMKIITSTWQQALKQNEE